MKRLTLAVLSLTALAGAFAGAPASAETTLRERITVSGSLVTLGDLFAGAGEAADVAVFQAPDPGTTGTVSASRVVAAATSHGLEVTPATARTVSVTRASRIVEEEELRVALAEAMQQDAGMDAELEIRLDRLDETLHIEPDALAPLSVRRVDYDPGTSRFAAVVSVGDSRILGEGLRVTGRALRMVELPVLQRQVKRGETIGATDVMLQRLPLSAAPDDAVRQLSDIVGMSARMTLRAGAPVPSDRLMEPILVGRNDAVTIFYRVPGLTLTVRGRALGEGARGDLVTVMNSQSNRTIEAIVAGPGQVVVEPPRNIVAAIASK